MRHLKTERKLGRNSAHRKAMYRNMVTSLLEHGRISTTLAKAKELRSHVERTITVPVRLGDLLDVGADARDREQRVRVQNAVNHVARTVRSREVVRKLFEDIAPRMRGRPGGYTRIIRSGRRVGDAAEMAIIELVDYQLPAAPAQVDASVSDA